MAFVMDMYRTQRAEGPAAILAIGTANPPNVMYQADYPDYYFSVTKSDHKVALKKKFKSICEKSTVEKRYMILTEEILKENPEMCTHNGVSIDARQDIVCREVPKLGMLAATKAIQEWGQPKSKITHLIFCTSAGVDMPSADFQLLKLLDLEPSVNRVMIYNQGCFAGATALRLAKDLSENNRGARVLIVCSETWVMGFQGPSEEIMDNLSVQAVIGDGAAALIVGADPNLRVERPLFYIASATQMTLPDSGHSLTAPLRKEGFVTHSHWSVPMVVSNNVENALKRNFSHIGITDWNDLFWVCHPGYIAVLNGLNHKVGLNEGKVDCSRHVLKEYGNMMSATCLFILDEMRKRSTREGKTTTGDGLDWGVLFGFGPGMTIETLVLHSVPTTQNIVSRL